MRIIETIMAHGHESVLSTNPSTFEITSEERLTKRGDCVIAVRATKGAVDLNPEFKDAARNERVRMMITIEAGDEIETVNAWGSSRLMFTHPTDLVVRKSDYVCGRTLAVRADKAAKDLSRRLVEKLRNPNQRVMITLTVETPS